MSGLICVFDGVDRNGLRYTVNYLSAKFEGDVQVISYDAEDEDCLIVDTVKDMIGQLQHRSPTLVLTNHLPSIPALNAAKYKTIVWLTDRTGASILKRQENIQFWRQTMGLLKSSNEQVYVTSQFMAKQILENYRVPCKVLHPYIQPSEEPNSSEIVYYNESLVHLAKLREQQPNQPFEKLVDYEDLKRAKLYIHVAVGMEYANIEIPIAHSYGVPCIVENNGCLPEYVTAGDKTLPAGADDKQWVSTFKIAMRDRNINSETVKKLSFRYSHMSEIEERIKIALQKTKPMRAPSFQEIQAIARKKHAPQRPMPESKPLKKQPVKPVVIGNGLPKNDVDHVKNYLSDNDRVYFGCGGLGDAILTIAYCYKDPLAKVIFGANHENVKALFDAFKIPVMITRNFYPSVLGMTLHHYIVTHPHFKGAAHIPDSMNYGEWVNNSEMYLKRMVRTMPLLDMFGRMINPRNTSGVIGIAPRGSDHHNLNKQRYLSQDEFRRLARKFLEQNKTVIAFGSSADVDHYGPLPNNNFIWMTGDFGFSHPAPKYPSSFRHMLSCINGCDELYSVDTWLKTYGALAGIPTKVIMSRRSGVTIKPPNDASDYIFMNQNYWGFDLVDVKDLLQGA